MIQFLEILVRVPFKIRFTTNFELISVMGFSFLTGPDTANSRVLLQSSIRRRFGQTPTLTGSSSVKIRGRLQYIDHGSGS